LRDDALANIRREKIGFIFQSFQLIHTLTVFENVELPLLLAASGTPVTAGEKLSWWNWTHLARATHISSPADKCSGWRLRERWCKARPYCWPTNNRNLDTSTGNLILELLQRLTRQQNTATIMATHSPEAAALADVVVKLRTAKSLK